MFFGQKCITVDWYVLYNAYNIMHTSRLANFSAQNIYDTRPANVVREQPFNYNMFKRGYGGVFLVRIFFFHKMQTICFSFSMLSINFCSSKFNTISYGKIWNFLGIKNITEVDLGGSFLVDYIGFHWTCWSMNGAGMYPLRQSVGSHALIKISGSTTATPISPPPWS